MSNFTKHTKKTIKQIYIYKKSYFFCTYLLTFIKDSGNIICYLKNLKCIELDKYFFMTDIVTMYLNFDKDKGLTVLFLSYKIKLIQYSPNILIK